MSRTDVPESAAELIRSRTGLRLRGGLLDTLQSVVERRCAELDLEMSSYLELLRRSDPDSGELERVVRDLTIGETYFFRGDQLQCVREELLGRLVERRRREGLRTLRLLSAGCATGEEPYSLAMALNDALDSVGDWAPTITGLDINTAFLRAAREGVYSEWSLRATPPELRRRHFRRTPRGFEVDPSIRRMVRFHYANLAHDPLPAPLLGVVGMDLVLCQNVLYYFERELRDEVVRKLAACLVPGGYLVFGPADLVEPHVPGCRSRLFGDALVFQRPEDPELASYRPPPSWTPRSGWPVPAPEPATLASEALQTPRVPVLEELAGHEQLAGSAPDDGAATEATPERDAHDEELTWSRALELANAGELEASAYAFDRLLEAHPDDAHGRLLHAFLLIEVNALEPALESLRRAIYLDSSLLLAHVAMSMLARRLGQHELAEREARRVRSLARRRPADGAIEGWEGMTVGRLLRLFDAEEGTFFAERTEREP